MVLRKRIPHPAAHALPYIIPFLLFAVVTLLGPKLGLGLGMVYTLKTVLVGACLIVFLPKWKSEIRFTLDLPAIIAGVIVFGIWIGMENVVPHMGEAKGFNPHELSHDWTTGLISIRMIGAVLVVPIMEELFWRSFALRFLIDTHFKRIPLGTFTWFSFILVSVAFGLEHHRWLPGILAGLVYAALLYRTKNLFSPILSHAVTNLLLGVYVLGTGEWHFW